MLPKGFRQDIYRRREPFASGTPEHHLVVSHHLGAAGCYDIMCPGVRGWYAGKACFRLWPKPQAALQESWLD